MKLNVFKTFLLICILLPLLGILYWPLVIMIFIPFVYSLYTKSRLRMISLLLLLIFLEGAVRPITERATLLEQLIPSIDISSLVLWELVEPIPIGLGHLTLGLLLMVVGFIESLRHKAILTLLIVALTLPGIYMSYIAGNNGFLITFYALIWLLWLVPLKRRLARLTVPEQSVIWKYLEWLFLIATVGFVSGLAMGHVGFLAAGLSFLSYRSNYIGKGWKILLVISHIIILITGTFTLKAIVGLSLLFFLLTLSKKVRAHWLKPSLVFLLIGGIALSIYLPMNSQEVIESATGNVYFSERLEQKIAGDRIPIWVASFQFTFSDLSLFVPSNRIVPLPNMPSLNNQWIVGAHNVFLEFLRQFGVWIGMLLVAIFSLEIYRSIKTSRLSLITGVLTIIFITYGFSGHYLIFNSVGLLFIFTLLLSSKTFAINTSRTPKPS